MDLFQSSHFSAERKGIFDFPIFGNYEHQTLAYLSMLNHTCWKLSYVGIHVELLSKSIDELPEIQTASQWKKRSRRRIEKSYTVDEYSHEQPNNLKSGTLKDCNFYRNQKRNRKKSLNNCNAKKKGIAGHPEIGQCRRGLTVANI